MIGASRKTGSGAYNGVEMMLRYGYKGKIYPINPQADEICGVRAFPSVAAVPEVADVATISVGRDHVISAFQQCIDGGIRRVIIITQGFSDADRRGSELQNKIRQMAKESGVRVLGPNTLGVLNNFCGVTTGFLDFVRPEKFYPVGLIAQTGLFHVAPREISGLAWGKAVDIGNSSDVDFVDVLEYFGGDPETRVIAIYMEGILRGREFIEAASRISRQKPIIVLKSGRTAAGAKAALSHTGSLVGEDAVNDAAFRRAGIIRVQDSLGLRDAIRALVRFEAKAGPRVGVLTSSGGGGIMATDACSDFGLTIGSLPEGLAGSLKHKIPDWIHVGNPVDIWPVGMLGDGYGNAYRKALTGLLQAPDLDAAVAVSINMNSPLHKDIDIVKVINDVRREADNDKPIGMWIYGQAAEEAAERLNSIKGVACFDTVEQAVRALSLSWRYRQIKERKPPVLRRFAYDRAAAEPLLQKGRKRKILLGDDALRLLAVFGIPSAVGITVRSWRGIEAAAAKLSRPLVLKLSGEDFLHKSEWGGVATGINSKKELRESWRRMKENVRRRNPKLQPCFQLQEQVAGKELLLGLKRDADFGHIIACGLGGIYTEVFKDVSRELVPIGRSEAEDMLAALKIYPLLTGVRGEEGVDLEALLDILERLSFLAGTIPDIAELDINPLLAAAAGCRAVDARIIW